MKVLNNLTSTIAYAVGHTKTFCSRNSAEILLIGGAIGVVTGTVMACKATLKADSVMDEYKAKKEKIGTCLENPEIDYDEITAKEDLKNLTIQTAVKMIKCYAPAVILESFSIGTIFASNHIMQQRNAALAASCAAVEAAYKKYREKVVEKYGKEVDDELYYGTKTENKKITTTDPETGEKTKTTESKTYLQEEYGCSPYAVLFDSSAIEFYQDDATNMFMLKNREKEATVRLRANGMLTLNDVYEMIGVKPTDIGLTHGWIFEKDNPDGDNEVKFDMRHVYVKDPYSDREERAILIDFNCDGFVYGRVTGSKKAH